MFSIRKFCIFMGFTFVCFLFAPFTYHIAKADYPIAYEVLDNDDGGYGSNRNYMWGTWKWKNPGGTANYRGDYRISAYGDQGTYVWKFNTHSGGRLFYVYLNNVDFKNPDTTYFKTATNYSGVSFVHINQETRPGGWNPLNTSYLYQNDYYPYLSVHSDDNGNTGADGAEVDYY